MINVFSIVAMKFIKHELKDKSPQVKAYLIKEIDIMCDEIKKFLEKEVEQISDEIVKD